MTESISKMADSKTRLEEVIAKLKKRGYRMTPQRMAILNEEVEHESWFSEFLGEGPSGHYLRRGETSPFVEKFMR